MFSLPAWGTGQNCGEERQEDPVLLGDEVISSLLVAPKLKVKPGDAQPDSRCEPQVLARLDFKKRLLLLLKRLSSFPTETPSVGCERTC